MQSAPSANPLNTPSAQIYVGDQDPALYAALIGRKPMSKTLRESISEQPITMTPVPAAPEQPVSLDHRHRVSVWIHHVSIEAKKRISEARSRLGS